jgi:ribonuclease Z
VVKITILGSSNAIPDDSHDNTHMAIVGEKSTVLIDCVNNPIVRLRQAGIDYDDIRDIILTHFHPDHVSGMPLLLMGLWLLGRKLPLNIYGLDYTIERMEKVMEFYDWMSWPNFFPVNFHGLADSEMAPVMATDEFRIYSSPVCHLVPTIGLRVELVDNGKVMAYSCDTEPCKQVVRLSENADVLIHECSGDTLGHTSAPQAGEIARNAGAGALYLIHYPTGDFDTQSLVRNARTTFDGPVALAEDFMQIEL